MEIDDLRVANSEFTLEVWDSIRKEILSAFPSGRARYEDFVSVVIQTMRGIKGEAFTIQLGHLLDRVAVDVLEETERGTDDEASMSALERDGDLGERTLPLPLLFAILSLALNCNVKDRVQILFEAARMTNGSGDAGEEGGTLASEEDVIKMVEHLQHTCQLAPDAQIVYGDQKYPVQQYQKGTAAELVAGAKKTMGEEGIKDFTGDNGDKYDVTDFHRLLRTKSVCAW
eukprot:CAMPEP_0183309438 /NCGR_PEP_ID=MMETSP0160_2-20130417/25341_1 /TAXON_ID=2839 ORGANISM="Odontella Sinensis, Strain Grunow 1884" /NCGR_SAMPLE_ID=MMETSP0160_2 /ASSEMBLY_ACC=CAM_ASM_000250 /LENGTH=228 /DNA_ID=CAMNT_0025473465 /DNA_START=116 /DNA_END=799 /DNA_ORIENTATION=-